MVHTKPAVNLHELLFVLPFLLGLLVEGVDVLGDLKGGEGEGEEVRGREKGRGGRKEGGRNCTLRMSSLRGMRKQTKGRKGGREGRGTYHHEIGAEVREAGERFMPGIGDVTRVLVLEQRKPEVIVPSQGIPEESGLGAHRGGPSNPDCVGIFTPEDWDSRGGT